MIIGTVWVDSGVLVDVALLPQRRIACGMQSERVIMFIQVVTITYSQDDITGGPARLGCLNRVARLGRLENRRSESATRICTAAGGADGRATHKFVYC